MCVDAADVRLVWWLPGSGSVCPAALTAASAQWVLPTGSGQPGNTSSSLHEGLQT